MLDYYEVDMDQLNAGPRNFEYMREELDGKDIRPIALTLPKGVADVRKSPSRKKVFGLFRETAKILAVIGEGADAEVILEQYRIYKDGSRLRRKGFQTNSETRKIEKDKEEGWYQTVIRAFEEELEIHISTEQVAVPDDIDYLRLHNSGIHDFNHDVRQAWSSVYHGGVWSIAAIHPSIGKLPKRPWPEDTVEKDDCGVKIGLTYQRIMGEVPEFLAQKVRALDR